MKKLTVEIYSDFICPWCYIAKSRLLRLKNMMKEEVELDLHMRPFMLYPDIPPEGWPKSVFNNKSKPGTGRGLREETQEEDIDLNYHLIDRIPSSRLAHHMVSLSPKKYQTHLALLIFEAYFNQGLNIGSPDILNAIAQNISDEIPKAEEGHIDSPLSGTPLANSREITRLIPTIRLNEIITLPGLQPTEIWMNYLRRASRMG